MQCLLCLARASHGLIHESVFCQQGLPVFALPPRPDAYVNACSRAVVLVLPTCNVHGPSVLDAHDPSHPPDPPHRRLT